MFKQLTNVRPSKTESPEVSTTPTNGNIKLNAPAATKLGVNVGDYAVIATDNGKVYIAKGSEGNKENNTPNVGAKLASTNGKNGGSLQFSSENAFREMGGNKDNKRVFAMGDPVDENGGTPSEGYTGTLYYELTFTHNEEKVVKKAAETTA